MDKYFGETANANFGRLTASATSLFRACRPGYEKITIWIEFKYHSTQKASYRIKRVLIHILGCYVVKLIARRGKTTPKGLIKAKFTYLLHFFSFLDQTCQIDYGCGPNDCKFSFDAKCQIVTSPNGLNGIFNFKVKLISFESALEEE